MTFAEEFSFSKRFVALLKWLGLIGGAVAGFGAITFAIGFLAQRSLYAFKQVPFVFVDYWAYAETGFSVLVRSAVFVFRSPFWVLLVAAVTIASFLLLELRWFRRIVLKVRWVFFMHLFLTIFAMLIATQLLQIRDHRNLRRPPSGNGEAGTSNQQDTRLTFPFNLGIVDPATPPDPATLPPPESAGEAWTQLAAEIERGLSQGAVYLSTHPSPLWALRPDTNHPSGSKTWFGEYVHPGSIDPVRSENIYARLVWSLVLATWLLAMGVPWLQRSLAEKPSGEPRSLLGRVFVRLKEEMWFSIVWVLRPVSCCIVLVSGLLLLPQCYGTLVIERVGHELVEVVGSGGTSRNASPVEDTNDRGSPTPFNPGPFLDEARDILNEFHSHNRTPEGRKELRNRWERVLLDLEKKGTSQAVQALRKLATGSSSISPELADLAWDRYSRSASRADFAQSGYLLHYPRSEKETLRLLQPHPLSLGKRWTIQPVPLAKTVEVRVARDEESLRLIDILRSLPNQGAPDRIGSLIEAEWLGHPRLLEVAIASSYDYSPVVRGPAITDIGRYAARISSSRADTRSMPETEFRRGLARTRLMAVLLDPNERSDVRGAAVTSLALFARQGEPEICDPLIQQIASADAGLRVGRRPELSGTVISAIGLIGCKGASSALVGLLGDEKTDYRIRSVIPTALVKISTHPEYEPALRALLEDPHTPKSVLGPALSAAGQIEGGERGPTVKTLVDYLRNGPEARVFGGPILLSLLVLGSEDAVPAACAVARGEIVVESPDVRRLAFRLLSDIKVDSTEKVLLEVASDTAQDDEFRIAAIQALSSFSDPVSVETLAGIAREEMESAGGDGDALQVVLAIIGALEGRQNASTEAGNVARSLLGELHEAVTDVEEDPIANLMQSLRATELQSQSLGSPPFGPGVATNPRQAIESLRAGSVGPFLEFMSSGYFGRDVWLSEVLPLFPFAEWLRQPTGTDNEQDYLWYQVEELQHQLQWDEDGGFFTLGVE
jgi:hypothetical protein